MLQQGRKNMHYQIWGKAWIPEPGDPQVEFLDEANTVEEAEEKIAEFRKIDYFNGWKLWHEEHAD